MGPCPTSQANQPGSWSSSSASRSDDDHAPEIVSSIRRLTSRTPTSRLHAAVQPEAARPGRLSDVTSLPRDRAPHTIAVPRSDATGTPRTRNPSAHADRPDRRTRPSVCQLCAQVAGHADVDLVHQLLGGAYRRPVLIETDRFVAMPSVGALAPGHLLLSPKRHVRSLAALSANEIDEAVEMLERLARRLEISFGGPVQLFEHGNATCGSTVACSVEHAHLHVLPAVPDLWPAPPLPLQWTRLPGLTGLAERTGGREYVSLRAADGIWRAAVCPSTVHVPSQLLRRHAATLLGRPHEWNWRTHPAIERLRLTIDGYHAGRTLG